MTVEQREREEKANDPEVKEALVQKLESYLRAHFDEKSAKHYPNSAMERLLIEVGQDWCYNNKVSTGGPIVWDACEEAIKRYRKNWKDKKQGEDGLGTSFGKTGSTALKTYGGEIA